MRPLLRAELFKLTHRLMTRVLLLLALAAPLGAYLLLGSIEDTGDNAVIDDLSIAFVHQHGMFMVYQVAVVAAVVLAASSIASEFSWGTIRTFLPRTAGRAPFLTAKLALLLGFILTAVIIGLGASLAGSALVTAFNDLDSNTGSNFIGRLAQSVLTTSYAIVPYATLAFLVALWTRSSAAGIGVPIVVFYTEVLLTPVFTSSASIDWLPQALIYSANISALVDSDNVLPASDLPGKWQAAGVLTAYATAFISLAYWRFLSRDIR